MGLECGAVGESDDKDACRNTRCQIPDSYEQLISDIAEINAEACFCQNGIRKDYLPLIVIDEAH